MQLSVKQVSIILNIPEETVYQWIGQKSIPAHEVNGQVRFNRSELLEWATSRGMHVSPGLFEEDGVATAMPSLCDALRIGGIAYNVGGSDLPSVLHEVVHRLKLEEEVDREFLYEVLLARETLGSTGIGDGIAIPHVRNPVILHVQEPSVMLCFLDNPIEFHAVDGKPVHTLFTFVSPIIQTHLHLLARLSFVLGHFECKEVLRQRAPAEDIMNVISKIESTIPIKGR